MSKQITLSNSEIAAFCEQMAMILKSGITPKDGLDLMLNDAKDNATREVLRKIISFTLSGDSFTSSLKSSELFPEYVENMVAIGEETGRLDEVMQSLADYYNHEDIVADNIRSAITYPLIMVCMMVFIIIVLITKVLPLFNQVFIQLGTEMSGISASLLRVGQSLQTYSIVLVVILVALLAFVVFISRTNPGKALARNMKNHFGPTKSFFRNIAYGRFASGMALTLSSGMGIYQALNMVKELVEHDEVEGQIDVCERAIQEDGDSFAEGLMKAGLFGNLYSRMIAIGVKTGDVDEILKKIGHLYEEDTDKRLQSFISIIEPTLVIVLSLIVGLILLSVILPLLGVMSSIG